jgi:ribonuclease BN (tRNA processing enzyme)
VQVIHDDTCIILDGGSGILQLGATLSKAKVVNIFLTHLHFDHIIGLGFFQPFYNPNVTVNIWGPTGSADTLEARLKRYFSPPLFPVHLQDLPCKLILHEISNETLSIGSLKVTAAYVCHPSPTVAYRIESENAVFSYMPDHEPALGSVDFPNEPLWTSGYNIAENADLLLHDGQYKNDEYENRIGWGHSSMEDAIKFATMAHVKKVLFFHHDPMHTDQQLLELFDKSVKNKNLPQLQIKCVRNILLTSLPFLIAITTHRTYCIPSCFGVKETGLNFFSFSIGICDCGIKNEIFTFTRFAFQRDVF